MNATPSSRKGHHVPTVKLLIAGEFVESHATEWRDIDISEPGELAADSAGNVWVAQKRAGAIAAFDAGGRLLNTIRMAAASRPSALYFDAATQRLMVGDEGPDMNIKIYDVSPRTATSRYRTAPSRAPHSARRQGSGPAFASTAGEAYGPAWTRRTPSGTTR